MRVAYVCADPGVPVTGTKGASIHVQQIVRAFSRRGDDVTVYCTRLGDGAAAALDGVPIVARPERPAGPGGRTPAERERSVALAAAALAGLAEQDGCELVYERYALFSDASARIDAPSVVEVNAPLIDEQRRYRALDDERGALAATRTLLGGAAVVACVSEPVAAWAREHGADAGGARVVVVPNGVDTRAHVPAATDPAAPLRVAFVGSLKPWHGVDIAIDAVSRLDGVELTIIGDGPERAALEARAPGAPVRWTGALPHDAIPAALATMDVGVAPYPSHAGTYFSPLKAYEYLAAGLATVASDVAQLPAIVDHGRTGLLTPADDVGALAAALARLRDDRALARRMGAAGRAEALEHHDWDRVLDRILAPLALAPDGRTR